MDAWPGWASAWQGLVAICAINVLRTLVWATRTSLRKPKTASLAIALAAISLSATGCLTVLSKMPTA